MTQSQKNVFLIIVGILIIIVATGYGFWRFPQASTTDNEVESTNAATGSIKYLPQSILLKSFPIPKTENTKDSSVNLYKIGDIENGKFAGKILALGTHEIKNEGYSAFFIYFITDADGQPIAWDKKYNHSWEGQEDYLKQFFNLTDNLQTDLSFLPPEFSRLSPTITDKTGSAIFSTDDYDNASDILELTSPNVEPFTDTNLQSQSGFKIIKKGYKANYQNLTTFNYYLLLPFDMVRRPIYLKSNFMGENGIPNLSWTIGTTSIADYNYGQYAYGWDDCFKNFDDKILGNSLSQTGQTSKGDPIYEVDSNKYPAVYQCLYEKTKRYIYNEVTQSSTEQYPAPYNNFILSHPMFFWKHPTGDYVAFLRTDLIPQAEKAKPVIYLYPQQPTAVSVKVDPMGGFNKTIPAYEKGWKVLAFPDGQLTNLKNNQIYPYLFWEGGNSGTVVTPKEGFVIAKNNMMKELSLKLTALGLNEKEKNDFLEFWVPKLSKAPYYFITFISSNEINRVAPLNITPKPDSIIRILMDYRPLEKPISVKPLEIKTPSRNGFTIVEWGGILRD